MSSIINIYFYLTTELPSLKKFTEKFFFIVIMTCIQFRKIFKELEV